MEITSLLKEITAKGASDIFIVAGRPLTYKLNGKMHTISEMPVMPQDTLELVSAIYYLADQRDMSHLLATGDDDFSFAVKGISRFRASTYKQRGSLSAVIRIITFSLPSPYELHIPDSVMDLANARKGLVLVTGPAGGGKSTTLACMIDKINREQEKHIITLEDPLEYLHRHRKSIVSQREICTDTDSYLTALRAALRQSPDVILLGEMRDHETMNVAMTAAETGHLIFSTLHTIGAANTIERVVDAFPPNQQHQITIQLSTVLQAVVSQQLLPAENGTVLPAFEVMILTPAIRTMIREGNMHQIDSAIFSSSQKNMISMDSSIYNLYQKGLISSKTAIAYATNPDSMAQKTDHAFSS